MATRFLSLAEVLDLYSRELVAGGGASAIRDLGALESALAQPRATFADEDLYPSLAEQASALGFSLILNHPFVDGNKRIGHAAGTISRDEFTAWIRQSLVVFPGP